MEVVYTHCAGVDIGKREVVACVFIPGAGHERRQKEIRTFSTQTAALRAMKEWFAEKGVAAVAMESTGSFWKPIFNLLEDRFQCILVNPQHVKALPGRKTDVKDAEWLCDLLQHGLLKPSFVPNREQRELRELVRYRTSLVQERAREVNRVEKILEGANIKLGSVASDILGVSGTAMLRALVDGQLSPEAMADLAKGTMRAKIPDLALALDGFMASHQRQMLTWTLDHIDYLDKRLEELDEEVATRTRPFEDVIKRLDAVPGIGLRIAQVIVAEVGADAKNFTTAAKLAAWTGLSPGNKSSAGKRLSGRTRPGNPHLRTNMIMAGQAAGRSKDSYLSAQFHRLVRIKGTKRAAVAVAHSIIVDVWYILHEHRTYADLGVDYFERLDPERAKRQAIRRLEALGFSVTLAAKDTPAA